LFATLPVFKGISLSKTSQAIMTPRSDRYRPNSHSHWRM